MALYRTYRPQTFASVVGQDHVKRTLMNAVAHQLVAHAYLFAGSRGSGKTSVARILAMAVNCPVRAADASEPCGNCESCESIRAGRSLAVVEIDAASNRGIDEIRTLRETIRLAPGAGVAKKVYIIDEVHMLTKEAFNALLKTLEEPPAHALFILATTELNRVPDTIISRVQHFAFRRATPGDIRSHLKWVAEQEQLRIEDAAVELLVLHADGAFRDALSLLGQLQATGESPVTADTVRLVLGIAPSEELARLILASLASDAAAIQAGLAAAAERGDDPGAVIDELILLMRALLWRAYGVPDAAAALPDALAAVQAAPGDLIGRIEALVTAKQQLRWSPLPFLPVELALLPDAMTTIPQAPPVSVMSAATLSGLRPDSPRADSVADAPSTPAQCSAPPASVPEVAIKSAPAAPAPEPIPADPPVVQQVREETVDVKPFDPSLDLGEIWKQVVAQMQGKNASLAALLKASTLMAASPTEAVVGVPFNFYADRITDRKNAVLLADILIGFGIQGTVRCELSGQAVVHEIPAPSPMPAPSAPPPPAAVLPSPMPRNIAEVEADVRDIFGVTEPQPEQVA